MPLHTGMTGKMHSCLMKSDSCTALDAGHREKNVAEARTEAPGARVGLGANGQRKLIGLSRRPAVRGSLIGQLGHVPLPAPRDVMAANGRSQGARRNLPKGMRKQTMEICAEQPPPPPPTTLSDILLEQQNFRQAKRSMWKRRKRHRRSES